MKNVRSAIDRIISEASAPVHSQTVNITQRAHHELRALAEHLNRSKSSLAAELLEAAILDAIEHLDEMPVQGLKNPNGEEYTAADLVRMRAKHLYQEYTKQRQLEQQTIDDLYAGRLDEEIEQSFPK